MKLHLLKRSSWLKDKAKQRGRGNGTGTGNYSGKGLKGQKARSWHSMKAFFEWGQTSIVQRLPKARGFKRPFKLVKVVAPINLGTLQQDARISDTMEITKTVLHTLWYIKHESVVVKILGDGDYSKHLTFTGIELFSKSAQEKMAAPGKGKQTTNFKVQKTIKEQKKDEKVQKDVKAEAIKANKKARAEKKTTKAPTKVVVKEDKPAVKKTTTAEGEAKKPAVKKTTKKASE